MSSATPIRGIFTPNLIPLDARGDINEPELRRYVDWLIERGVHGLYPNGSTGEFLRFTAAERRWIIEVIVDQAAGRVPVLAGAAEANTAETIEACEYYYEIGARAVAIVSPFYYRVGPEGVYAYFKEIADNVPIDITLYNIPQFASPIDVATVVRLAEECPRVAAMKDSSGDLSHMERLIAAVKPRRPDFALMTGWDPQIVPALLLGCDGGTNATSGIAPEWTRQLFDLTTSGEIEEAVRQQFRLTALFDAVLDDCQFPEGIRTAVRLRGIETGPGRMPLSPKQQEEMQAVTARIEKQLAAGGLLGTPPTASAI